jgi:hypothetical protein
MTTDERHRLIVAEMRAGQLLATLRAAVDGAPHWRRTATYLLAEIDALRPPPLAGQEAA